MQNIIIDKPYRFVPPSKGNFWPKILEWYNPRYLRRTFGIESVECRGVERLKESVRAGHGIILAPNHCRPCDPFIMTALAPMIGRHFFIMASWHLFMQNALTTWLLRKGGAFSIYREGMDKAALNAAIEIIVSAERPLIIFPEGIVSRTNDVLSPLMEGVSFIARTAAKKRAQNKSDSRVVVHGIAIKYLFSGDIQQSAHAVLNEIETRLTWQSQNHVALIDRLYKVGGALLSIKEIEYLGAPQNGAIEERLPALIDRLLDPLEKEWCNGKREPNTVARVKKLRAAILPDMVGGELAEEERARRWRQLADLYLVQQLDFYRPGYVRSFPSPERILETIERFEEDLTDKARIHRPMRAVAEIGEGLEVNPQRERGAADPLMQGLETQMSSALKRLSEELTQPIRIEK